MFKNKILVLIALCFYLVCNNSVFAVEIFPTDNVYPDFNYEFTGKDTFEKFNRKLFVFNLKLNKYVLRPVNIVWASVMPKYGMDRLQNAYNNMNYPVRLMGCLLQKDFKASKQETLRFLANTTIGVGGLYDPAQTKFKLEPYHEDLEQAFAKMFKKQGPYLVLPVVQGNIRDLIGKLLACPLRPTTYAGFFGTAANLLFAVNNTTYLQPMFKKVDESCADPYIVAKEADGISKYIKCQNLDRKDVFAEKLKTDNLVNVNGNGIFDIPMTKADIELKNFNPQNPLVDSFRTALFDNQNIGNSIWADMSVWNRTFGKKIKVSSVNVFPSRAKYNFKYILQKEKNSPLAILYPSIGEGITAEKSVVLAKILYEKGYSVIIQGSSFNWEFVKSMPKGYVPGFPAQDSEYLRLTSQKIIDKLEHKLGYKFDKRILVGCSYGALTGLFTASQEDAVNSLNISKYIAINPPVEIMFGLNKLDNYCADWKKSPTDMKMKAAVTAEKIVNLYNDIDNKDIAKMPETLPFTNDEAELAIGVMMKQKLYDTVFAVENCYRGKKSGLEAKVNNMTFSNYAQKYLDVTSENYDKVNYETSLYSMQDFLGKSNKIKIYHSMDDYFVNQSQLTWLKQNTGKKTVLFSNGSHLGEMYRKEFTDQFKNDISSDNPDENVDNKNFQPVNFDGK